MLTFTKKLVDKLIIPETYNSIESNTFFDRWSLESVIIPNSVKSIGIYAFCNCWLLESIGSMRI